MTSPLWKDPNFGAKPNPVSKQLDNLTEALNSAATTLNVFREAAWDSLYLASAALAHNGIEELHSVEWYSEVVATRIPDDELAAWTRGDRAALVTLWDRARELSRGDG